MTSPSRNVSSLPTPPPRTVIVRAWASIATTRAFAYVRESGVGGRSDAGAAHARVAAPDSATRAAAPAARLFLHTFHVMMLDLALCLGQEPGAAFGLVDPDFDQAGRRDIVVLFAHSVRGTQIPRQVLVVRHQLPEHLAGADELLVVVPQALVSCDVGDRPAGG